MTQPASSRFSRPRSRFVKIEDHMPIETSRRQFARHATGLSFAALLPRMLGDTARTERIVVRADSEIGPIRPELHGHFAEHLGSCVYGGLWVGKNSPIPNVDGYRKEAID